MRLKTRFQFLTEEIHRITHRRGNLPKTASVKELGDYLKMKANHVSQEFSKSNRGPGPGAERTLLALKWVCLKKDVNFVVPDWEALRYCVLRSLKKSRNKFSDDLREMAARLKVKSPALRAYCYGPWVIHARKPKGDITLRL